MTPDVLPTPGQAACLARLARGERAGRVLRAEAAPGKSGPAFYHEMSRLEALGWVEGRYKRLTIGGAPCRERWYSITDAGRLARCRYVETIQATGP